MDFKHIFNSEAKMPMAYAIYGMVDKKRCYFYPMNLKIDLKLDTYSEITFDADYYYFNETTKVKYKNPLYDFLDCSRIIHIESIGFFKIVAVSIESDGYRESKHIEAYSIEYELTTKFMNELTVRLHEQGDNMVLYNSSDKKLSVLNKVLEHTRWNVGYCDPDLAATPIPLDLDRTSRYDILMSEIREICNCNIIFDPEHYLVNIYPKDYSEKDTNIYISFDNLMLNAEVRYKENDIRTSLRVEGNNISIRDINGGSNIITDLSYYAHKDWMGSELAYKYKQYKNERKRRLPYYEEFQKYLTTLQLKYGGLKNNRPYNDQHLWKSIHFSRQRYDNYYDYQYVLDILDFEEELHEEYAKDQPDQTRIDRFLSSLNRMTMRAINYFCFGRNADSDMHSEDFIDQLQYGSSYMEEGIAALNQLIESEQEKAAFDSKYISKEHYYQCMLTNFYQAGKDNRKSEEDKFQKAIAAFQEILSILNHSYTYEGFIYPVPETCIFNNKSQLNTKHGVWALDEAFDQAFIRNDFDYIIANTKHFSALWHADQDLAAGVVRIKDTVDDDGNAVKEEETFDPIRVDGSNTLINLLLSYYLEHEYSGSSGINIKNYLNISGTPYFTNKEIELLSYLELEDEYKDNNFKLYKDDSKAVTLDKARRLYEAGERKLLEMCSPSLSFTSDILNPFMLQVYRSITEADAFSLGRKIQIILRNDYILEAELSEISIDFSDISNPLSFTYSNVSNASSPDPLREIQKLGSIYSRLKDALIKLSELEFNMEQMKQ